MPRLVSIGGMNRGTLCILIIMLTLPNCQKMEWPPNHLEESLSALAPEVEIVYFADKNTVQQPPIEVPLGIVYWPVQFLFSLLHEPGLDNLLKDRIGYVMMGAKNFRPPRQLGPNRWDGLYILELSFPAALPFEDFFQGQPISDFVKTPVWRWEHKVEQDVWPVFMTQARDRCVFIATNLDLLRSVLNRLELGNKRESLDDLPGWKLADRRSSVWAVRRYRHTGSRDLAGSKPSADFRSEIYREAVAVTFSFYDKSKLVSLCSVTSGTNSGPLRLLQSEAGVSVSRVKPGVWSTSFRIDDSELSMKRLWITFGLLGFEWSL